MNAELELVENFKETVGQMNLNGKKLEKHFFNTFPDARKEKIPDHIKGAEEFFYDNVNNIGIIFAKNGDVSIY